MKVYAQFHCPGYSTPYPDQYETFDSIEQAKQDFWQRCCSFDPMFPCVEKDQAEMHLFFGPPDEQDCMPDRILTIGPRDGVRYARG